MSEAATGVSGLLTRPPEGYWFARRADTGTVARRGRRCAWWLFPMPGVTCPYGQSSMPG